MIDGETQITTSFKKNNQKHEDEVAKEILAEIVTPIKNPSVKMSSRKKQAEGSKKEVSSKKVDSFWSTGKKLIIKSTQYIRDCISKEKSKKKESRKFRL